MASIFAPLVTAFALLVIQPPVAKSFVVPSRPGTVQALMDCFDNKIFNSDNRDAPAIITPSFLERAPGLCSEPATMQMGICITSCVRRAPTETACVEP
jgi:hypothetical protein